MTKLMKPAEKSRSLTLGKIFPDEYLEHNPLDEVDFLISIGKTDPRPENQTSLT